MTSDEWWQLALGDSDWDGKEWDGEWSDDWWKMAYEYYGDEIWGDNPAPNDLESEEPKVEPLNDIHPTASDECVTVNGMFWHPFNSQHIEVGPMISHILGKNGEWNAYYQGDDGNLYSLTCLGKNLGGPGPSKNGVVDPSKIKYAPISKQGVQDFAEKAWPNGSPSGSGVVRGRDSPSLLDLAIDNEQLKYPEQPQKLIFVAAQIDCQFGDKPKGNTNPLELNILTGMTLAEHMAHIKFYETTGAFEAQFPDDTPEELWGELCEMFKFWHAYNIDDPEIVVNMLRAKYAQEPFAVQWFSISV